MAFTNQTLIFESQAVETDTLLISRLEGEERVSGLFRFELELLSSSADLDLGAILAKPAKIGIKEQIDLGGGNTGWTTHWISGELESFARSGQGQSWTGYRAVLVPRLSAVRESFRSRVFLDQCAPDIIKGVLADAGLADGDDFDFSDSIKQTLTQDPTGRASYPQREYVVQFEESDFDFVSRWLEHEGIFYHFDNTDPDLEKVVFGDSLASYRPLRGTSSYPYRPQGTTTGEASSDELKSVVTQLDCVVGRLPREVILNDYNWRTPDASMRCSAEVDPNGRGVHYEYNYHYKTNDQGKALATVLAEGLVARSQVFSGAGTCRNMRAGYTFSLTEHTNPGFNQDYYLTAVRHVASQEISLETSSMSDSTYACEFEAIPASTPFRPEAETDWPAIRGVIQGKIDGSEDGQYAELDAQGRYKVVLPFDADGPDREPGQASRYMRLATPYAGSAEGMSFPLRPGTEVMITHIDGDPDRPVIAGALNNPNNPSLTDTANQSQNLIQTSSGNAIRFQDEEGRQGITLASANGGVYHSYAQPGAMGSGGGGTGGGSGGALRGRVRQAVKVELPTQETRPQPSEPPAPEVDDMPAAARLPGGGAGMGEVSYYDDDDASTDEGADEYWAQYNDSLALLGVSTSDWNDVKERWAKSFSPTGGVDGDYEGNEYTKDTVIEGLNKVCSSFSAYIGCYDTFIGPYTTVKMGDYGEWQEGKYKHDTCVFDRIWENADPPTAGSGQIYSRQGMKRKWNKIIEEMDCNEYSWTIGPPTGDYPLTVRQSMRAVWVSDELWAQGGVLNIYGAPMVGEVDLAALHIEIHTGIRFDISVGVTTSLAIMDNSYMIAETDYSIWTNFARLTETQVRLAELDVVVSKNTAKISENAATISDNSATITDNAARISLSRLAIAQSKVAIANNEQAISENEVALTTMKTALSANNAALSHRTSAIVVSVGLPS